MSPTRKPKPPDKGAPPEHKPSRKVALEEVMRSLQDLVSNELAIEPAKPADEAQTSAVKTKKTGSAENLSVAPAEIPTEPLPPNPPVTVDSVAHAESSALDRLPPTPPASDIPGSDIGLPDLAAESLTMPVAAPATTENIIPAGGLQQELPYLEDIFPVPAASPPEPTPTQTEPPIPESLPEALPLEDQSAGELPPLEVKTGVAADSSTPIDTAPMSLTTSAPPAAEETIWDDFPVLEEAVELAEEFDADELGHRAEIPPSAKLPPADTARRLAIQVAARLNVELRTSGQAGLSSDIITRLARLLQEALAKGTANMENTTAKDGGSAENAGSSFPPTAKDGGSAENAGAVFRPPPDKH